MSRWIAWLLGILLIATLTFGAYSLYDRFEVIESITKITLKGKARKNPLYATRIFLNRMGIPASTKQSLQGLANLPDTTTVLIISSKRSTLSREAIKDLYTWVQAGGHLITRVNNDTNNQYDKSDDDSVFSDDPLQALLNVTTDSHLYISNKTQFSLNLKGAEYPLKIEGKSFYPIISRDNFLSKKNETLLIKEEVFILRRQIDNGMITLIADLNFINNREIREADHAEILWQLVHGLDKPNEVWLIHNDEMPPLWLLMWNKAWAFIITLTLLFVLWLRHASHRFGPMIPKAPEDRRSLLEHIRASGNFYWKHQQKDKLIASTREALNQRLALTHPGWKQLSDAEKIAQLAIRLERPQREIQQLLFDPNTALKKNQSDEFTQLIKQLEQIRNSL
ncbi:MAG: DUF4350 domain-containing protein [Cocleimonas sp.]|nr:DUF4350 domain-containing protein [Cocleimonas sp.]